MRSLRICLPVAACAHNGHKARLEHLRACLEHGLEAEPLAEVVNDPLREPLVHCPATVALSNTAPAPRASSIANGAMAIAESLHLLGPYRRGARAV